MLRSWMRAIDMAWIRWRFSPRRYAEIKLDPGTQRQLEAECRRLFDLCVIHRYDDEFMRLSRSYNVLSNVCIALIEQERHGSSD